MRWQNDISSSRKKKIYNPETENNMPTNYDSMSKKKTLDKNFSRNTSEHCENIAALPTIHEKPPLPKSSRRKRKSANSVLSSITNLALSSFQKKRAKSENMGSVCIKSSRLAPEQNHFQNKSTSKVSPSHSNHMKAEVSKNGPADTRVMFYKSDIEIEQVADIAQNGLLEEENDLQDIDQYPEVFDEPEEVVKIELSNIEKDNETDTISSMESGKTVNEKLPNDTTGIKQQRSLPDLRSNSSQSKRAIKTFSQGDRLKSSNGSTNLLDIKKTFVEKPICRENKSKSTSENVINVERRKKRLPTVENGIHVLEEGQVNYYEVQEEIGRGSFGAVCKCKSHKDNRYYAMKIISKKRLMRKNRQLSRKPGSKSDPLEPLYKEVAILKKMDHPNVVKLIEVIDDIQVDNFYMIFELMTNGVVIDVPTEDVIPEDRARELFRELVLGIEYLHYSKIIHRDIKPSNLILDAQGHLKIADFGVSNMFEGDDDRQSKYAGSPAFQAPEVLNYDSRDKYSGKAVDIWAMGITLYCFLYGKCPFYSNNIGELSDMIKNNLVTFPDTPILNPQVFDLMSRMLSKDANNRINIFEIKEHPWVTQGGNSPLPSTEDHCTVIEVTEDEVRNSIKIISKLSSLVIAKSILKGKSFLMGRQSKHIK